MKLIMMLNITDKDLYVGYVYCNQTHITKNENLKIQYGGRPPCWKLYFWL